MRHPKKPGTFGLYSTSKQSHIKVGSKNRRLWVGLIKTLINPPSFELGLMLGANRALLSVTPPNDIHACTSDKSVHFVCSDTSETFLSVIGHVLMT